MNKVVLVTGGSRGIGAAISERFAKEGYDIIINYKENEEKANKVKCELEKKYNVKVNLFRSDLANEKAIKQMVDKIYQVYENIDVLVNNAGIVVDKDFFDRTVNDWLDTMKVNLIGPFVLSKLIGKRMYERKKGSIVNISSTNGINTYYPSSVDYDASKSGIISLTYNMAVEFSPYVRVNAVAPGWVNTEMNKELEKEFIEDETKKILIKRFGEPKEIANVVYFLASDEATFINSEVLKVDGGWYL